MKNLIPFPPLIYNSFISDLFSFYPLNSFAGFSIKPLQKIIFYCRGGNLLRPLFQFNIATRPGVSNLGFSSSYGAAKHHEGLSWEYGES